MSGRGACWLPAGLGTLLLAKDLKETWEGLQSMPS